jgi:peptide/nickel transport system permease protein
MMRGDLGRALSNLALVLGIAGLIALATVALFGPQLTASDPQAQRVVISYPDGTFKVPPTPPDALFPLGTDPLGRDQLARLLWGARLTFTVVLLALLLRALLAVALGVLAGWRGGKTDVLITLVSNAVAGVPQLLLALLVAVALREHAIVGFVVALGIVGWAEGAQFVRAETIRIRAAPYIEAATALGERTGGIVGRHLLRSLGPQLFGLIALEAGATLLLLAELGFLGVFMSGAVFYVDESNRPILPVRDRAPEWGQMLAGAQQYAFSNQFVAFVPGVVVAAAVFTFNLLGEGVRVATDPFSPLALSPRAVGGLARGLAAFALVSAALFGVNAARSTELSFEEATRLAREAAQRVEPGDDLIAAVIRFSSESHSLAKPQKINFYFRQTSGVYRILRVGFPDADQNAMEVKHDDEDGLIYDRMRPLTDWSVPWTRALDIAEQRGGLAYRNTTRTWTLRVVLSAPSAFEFPTYRVMYGGLTGTASVDALVDARSGASDTRELRLAEAALRAEDALGGAVALTQATASWRARSAPGLTGGGFDTEKPVGLIYGFIRSDLPTDRRTAFVGFGAFAQAGVSASVGSVGVRPSSLSAPVDIEAAFAAVEAQGGRALREEWSRDGLVDWFANASATMESGGLVVRVGYGAPSRQAVSFRFDPTTGRVERAQ